MTSITTFNALILSLPARTSTIRMRVWRALKDAGCGVLRDGVYLLPAGAAASPVLAAMEAEIHSVGGFAMTLELKPRTAQQARQIRGLFDRGADYGALVRQMAGVKQSLPRVGARKARSAVQRLQRSLDKAARTDFFPGQAKRQAAEAMAALQRSFKEAYALGEPRASGQRLRVRDAGAYQKRVWATRRDPWVDRLASAWLIKRFIDREARFVWIDRPRERPRNAVGFDFDGAEFSHTARRVTFEVLLASFGLEQDPGLAALGAAVHFLDVGGIPVPDATGLETLLREIKDKARSDDALLAGAMRILDLFHSAYTRRAAAAA